METLFQVFQDLQKRRTPTSKPVQTILNIFIWFSIVVLVVVLTKVFLIKSFFIFEPFW